MFGYKELSDITPSNEKVKIIGRLQNIRKAGSLLFAILRDESTTVQAVAFKKTIGNETFNSLKKVNPESVVELEGNFVVAKDYVESCTIHETEFSISGYRLISESTELPLGILDAEESFKYDKEANDKGIVEDEAEEIIIEEKKEDPDEERLGKGKNKPELRNNVTRKVRLDHRWVDLRCKTNQLIVSSVSELCYQFRSLFRSKGFTEIFTPKLGGSAPEGGANVFEVKYFNRPAYLSQSPQLYKQMMINSGKNKVFEIGPVFRADNANTDRHLCQFTGVDMEMVIKPNESGEFDYRYLVNEIWEILTTVFNEFGKQESTIELLKILGNNAPVYPKDPCVLTFAEGAKLLTDNGYLQNEDEDLSTENEKKLGELVKKLLGSDLFFLTEYPSSARPFYTHPLPGDPSKTMSYDIIFRGKEISSGARRIENYSELIDSVKSNEINPDSLVGYLDSFKHGSMPHGGCGMGLERLIMLYFGLKNVRRASLFPRDPSRLYP